MAFLSNFVGKWIIMANLPLKIDLDNPEFQQAYELLEKTNANVFLTGKAGTGKSTFLRYICKKLRKKHIVLAPTGVAAVNVGGVTIHSFFQMPLRPVPPDDPEYSVSSLKKSKKYSKRKRKLIQELELIIIDEVSMVRPDMIDFMDRALKAVTGNRRKPFGGVQLLLVGDIFQLEPVVTNESKPILAKYYRDFFFFNARAYESASLVSVELRKIYRQTDPGFIEMLDRIRTNRATAADFKILNARIDPGSGTATYEGGFGITLTSRRDSATMINKEKMDLLPDKEYVFHGEIKDDFPEKILPTDLDLVLKKDAQVMLIRNDVEKKWVNGTIAKVCDISDNEIKVELENGGIVSVDKEEWKNINYVYDEKEKKVKEEVIGTFTQYPLKAAWALTIHKSQGLTFNNVAIDMAGGAFSAGQTYVALSRCRSLDGLCFINPLHQGDVIVSRGASDFSRNFNDPEAAAKVMREAKATELSHVAVRQFDEGEFGKAVESLWEINTLTGALSRKGVRRLLARSLGIIASLRKELRKKEKMLKNLSEEFTGLGTICMRENDDHESAYRNYAKAYKLDESNMRARFGMAEALIAGGEIKKGGRILNEILKSENPYVHDAHILKGDLLAESRDYAGAVIHYQSALKIDKDNEETVHRIINVYETAGREDMADLYRKWLEDKDGDIF